jgi:hypothetical protein
MRHNMHFMQEGALAFVNKLEEVDSALVVSFNESVKGSAEFTGDSGRLEQFVEGLEAWGGTSLYDAIHYGLGRIRDQPGRKAIIVFSDGADTTSSMKEQEVIDYARSVEATIYSVGIKGESGLMARSPRGFLRDSQETGGLFFSRQDPGADRIFTASRQAPQPLPPSFTPKRPPDGPGARSRSGCATKNSRVGPQGLFRGEAPAAARSDHQQLAPPRRSPPTGERPAKRV